jgi:hypothetical protein
VICVHHHTQIFHRDGVLSIFSPSWPGTLILWISAFCIAWDG